MVKPLIECRDICFDSSHRGPVFHDFSMSFLSGGFVVLYGSSGLGASVLLKILAQLLSPSCGKVETHGSISFINADDLDVRTTVAQELLYWGKIARDKEIVDIAADHFGLIDVMATKCRHMSAGELKRVVLARLIIMRHDIWLLDRPFAHLDDEGSDMLLSAIAGRVNNNGLVICTAGIERTTDYFGNAHKICMDDFCHYEA